MAKEENSSCHLIVDGKPPTESLWLVNKYGVGCCGYYCPDGGFVAYSPIPKLSTEQKKRLAELEEQGVDITKPISKNNA